MDLLTVYNNSVFDFIHKDFKIELLADDCLFTEGPGWNKEGFYLFSDIQSNVIYKIVPGKKKEIFLQNSGTDNPSDPDLKPDQIGSNALAYDQQNELIICQHGSHRIARYDGKNIHSLIDKYKDRLFNSPNDIVIHSDGRIY